MSFCQDGAVKNKGKKVKFSAGGSEANRECLIHVLDASKNDVVNKYSKKSWKVGTWFDFAVNLVIWHVGLLEHEFSGKAYAQDCTQTLTWTEWLLTYEQGYFHFFGNQ